MKRKIITALLVLCMLLALSPLTVMAGPPWIESIYVDPPRCAAGAEVKLRVWNAEPEGSDWSNEQYQIKDPGTTNATVTLDGMFYATSSGTATVKVTVFDIGRGGNFVQDVKITVYEQINITTQSLPNGQVGVPYVANLEATGSPKYWHWDSVTELPPGLDLVDKSETATIEGTPAKSGTYNIYVEASNNFTDARTYFSIEIAPASPDPTSTSTTTTTSTSTTSSGTEPSGTTSTPTTIPTSTTTPTTTPTPTTITTTTSTSTTSSGSEPSGTTPTPTTIPMSTTTPTSTTTQASGTDPTGTDPTKTDPGDYSGVKLLQQPPAWTKGSNESASFTSNADFKDFLHVKVDNEIVDESNYDVKEGSIIVTFRPSYLETLSTGKHPVEIVSASGSGHGTVSAHGIIEIKAQVDQEEVQVTKASDSTTKSNDATPKTGESSGYYPWLALILLSAGGLIFLVRRKRVS